MQPGKWLTYTVISIILMGVWGALIEIPEKNGFPATLGYVVWAIIMIPAALIALYINKWKLDCERKSIINGLLIGFLGAGGQLVLFYVLKIAPPYLVFPLISLAPLVTILFAMLFLKEKASKAGYLGILLALVSIVLLSYQPGGDSDGAGYLWLPLTLAVTIAWGLQGFILRVANRTMKAESIFIYMMLASVSLIAVALAMTDFVKPINISFKGPGLAALIQAMNAIGALFIVYAYRYGKAIIVAPMTTTLAPVLTVIISLIIYAIIPQPLAVTGTVLAITSAFLMSKEETKIN